MKNGTLWARFVGTDSLGYRYGQTYRLIVSFDHPEYPVTISRLDGSGFCPYESATAFFRNWELEAEKTFSRKPRTDD